MKITLKLSAPRNPLVVPTRARRAGPHRGDGGSMRQQSRRDLHRELDSMSKNVHSP